MAITVKTTWQVGIVDALAAGFDYLKVYGATTIDGTYSEVTAPGTRPALVAGVSEYNFTYGPTADLYWKASLYASGTGLESGLSAPVGLSSSAVTVITKQAIKVAFIHPEDLRAGWQSFSNRAVELTKESLSPEGNRPYVQGFDYRLYVAVLYSDEDGVEEGINLTGADVELTVSRNGTEIFSKSVSVGGITLLPQGVAWSDDGTRGVFQVDWTAGEDVADPYEIGVHDLECAITWADDDVNEQFSGHFEVARIG